MNVKNHTSYFHFESAFFAILRIPAQLLLSRLLQVQDYVNKDQDLTSSLDISKALQNGEKNCESLFTLYPSGLNHHSF